VIDPDAADDGGTDARGPDAPDASEAIRIFNLTKRYGRVVAVDNLNLNVTDGEFLVLLGPSGCGKTTTLRVMLDLDRDFRGEISASLQHARKAAVFQEPGLLPWRTVEQNIRLALRLPPQVTPSRIRQGFGSLISRPVFSSMILSIRPSTLNSPASQKGTISTSKYKPRLRRSELSVRMISSFDRTWTSSPGCRFSDTAGVLAPAMPHRCGYRRPRHRSRCPRRSRLLRRRQPRRLKQRCPGC